MAEISNPEGMTTKSDSQKATYPESFSVLRVRQAAVSETGMMVPIQRLMVMAPVPAAARICRKTSSNRKQFWTKTFSVSRETELSRRYSAAR